ncbi:MAG TPA: C-type lectin domain-containing protein [Polyangiaceae bacterium]|nr:C-type lectin domain-containing protein [Polyangiaceae bacterium]
MVPFPPVRREASAARLVRRWLFISAPIIGTLCGAAGCAGLLDIPDEPYLDEPAPASEPLQPGSGDAPSMQENGTSPSGGSAGTNSGFEVGMNNVQRDPPAPTTEPGDGDAPPPAAPDAGVEPPPDAAPPTPTGPCPTGATLGPNDRCFAIVATALVWDAARVQCQALGFGWDLASIHDAATNELVATLMTAEAWLGGSDAAFEGSWLWVGDNEPFWSGTGETGAPVAGAFSNWNSDEPNGGGPSDCMRLVAGLGTWADLQCSFERPAVCEGPAL